MSGLHAVDWVVMGAYLAAMVGVGAAFFKGQKDTEDFFLAGRSMGWLPVGLSVVASLFSAISYIALPSVYQRFGLVYLAGTTAIVLCVPIVTRVFMPFYSHLGLTSAYEYLERRFDVRVRCLASGLFILWRLVWMAVAVYAPSLAIWAATRGQVPLIPTILALGVFAMLYTALGGMKAVIWTDVIQFVVLFGGMVLAAALIVAEVPGGVGGIWQAARDAGKASLVSPIPAVEQASGFLAKLKAYFFCGNDYMTFWGVVISSFVAHIGFYTVDQVVVQRYFSARSLGHARKAFWLNAVANVCLHVGLAFLGFALLAYFKHQPHPATVVGKTFEHQWRYPYFIATAMPMGVAGLLIAALYAATMSSVDSGINSCTTAFTVDFWRRLRRGEAPHDDAAELRLARWLTLVFGGVATVIACFVGELGTIIEIAKKLVNSFCGPMFAIFVLGMFTRRARPLSVCIGAVTAMATMWLLNTQTRLNFLWPPVVGLVVALALGYALSFFERPPAPEKLTWTLAEQRKTW
ncbi:sodium/solute symporter [bacterium]|nr:sodium/solute symporter [bacterium]